MFVEYKVIHEGINQYVNPYKCLTCLRCEAVQQLKDILNMQGGVSATVTEEFEVVETEPVEDEAAGSLVAAETETHETQEVDTAQQAHDPVDDATDSVAVPMSSSGDVSSGAIECSGGGTGSAVDTMQTVPMCFGETSVETSWPPRPQYPKTSLLRWSTTKTTFMPSKERAVMEACYKHGKQMKTMMLLSVLRVSSG